MGVGASQQIYGLHSHMLLLSIYLFMYIFIFTCGFLYAFVGLVILFSIRQQVKKKKRYLTKKKKASKPTTVQIPTEMSDRIFPMPKPVFLFVSIDYHLLACYT